MQSFYVDIFVANNPNYSYVKKEEKYILDIVEKDVISPFASSGYIVFILHMNTKAALRI